MNQGQLFYSISLPATLRSRAWLLILSTAFVASVACRSSSPEDLQPKSLETLNRSGQVPLASLQFIAALDPSSELQDVEIGGLSGLVWDSQRQLLLAVSDDKGSHGGPAFFEFKLQLPSSDEQGTWAAIRRVPLSAAADEIQPNEVLDAESIDVMGEHLVISSESSKHGPPMVATFNRKGQQIRTISLPTYSLYGDGQGARDNMAVESVSVLPDGTLFVGFENALVQDGPAASVDQGSPVRIMRWRDDQRQEFVYLTDPVSDAPVEENGFNTNGLVELLALDSDRLLAMERSYTVGFLSHVKLFEVDLSQATDVANKSSIGAHYQAADKTLIANLDDLGINLDNLEGLAWGPELEDGRRTLLMVSDDNFSSLQNTHLLVFAVGDRTPNVSQIQGAGHSSPYANQWVFGVGGVITRVVETEGRPALAWLQGGDDGDLRTSDGVRIRYDANQFSIHTGHTVQVSGRITEEARQGQLGVTTLSVSDVAVTGDGELPAPIVLDPLAPETGAQVRVFSYLPLDDDAMETFDPERSTIDLLESLEGMRVTLPATTAVSATTSFGEIALFPTGAQGVRSAAGGVVLTESSFNPQRLIAVGSQDAPTPLLKVGDQFQQALTGVLDYGFANFKLQVDAWPGVTSRADVAHGPAWDSHDHSFSFASYNVLNLDPSDGDQFARIADSIVGVLGSPDILALQEIQDNNGPDDEGITSADLTLKMLVEALQAAGGPEYAYSQIDPRHNSESGQPFANIRVVYLFRRDRVELRSQGQGDTTTSVLVSSGGLFEPSPGRVAVDDPSFAGDDDRGWGGNRPCLAAEFLVADDLWQFVNCHLKSKRGDDRLFGPTQPPVFHTERQRDAQAQALATFSQEVLAANPSAKLIILGDTNEHDFRAPLTTLAAAGLENLTQRVLLAERYSFNFNGNSQLLDNVLISPAVATCSPQVAIAHINVDYPSTTQASDHDPVVVRIGPCSD